MAAVFNWVLLASPTVGRSTAHIPCQGQDVSAIFRSYLQVSLIESKREEQYEQTNLDWTKFPEATNGLQKCFDYSWQ